MAFTHGTDAAADIMLMTDMLQGARRKSAGTFSTRWHSREKITVLSTWRYACAHVLSWLPLGWFPWSLVMETFTDICQGNANLVKTWEKYRPLY